MAIKDNLGGGLKVNGFDISLPVYSGKSISKGEPVYMETINSSVSSIYPIDSLISSQTYSNTGLKLIPLTARKEFLGAYYYIDNGYMYLGVNRYSMNLSNTSTPYMLKDKISVKLDARTKALSESSIEYIIYGDTVIFWLIGSSYVLYLTKIVITTNSLTSRLYSYSELLKTPIANTLSGLKVSIFTPTGYNISGCTIQNNTICFHIMRYNSSYKSLELIAFDYTNLTFKSITCYHTMGSSETYYMADIQGSSGKIICYCRVGNFRLGSNANEQNLYDVYPPTIYTFACDPTNPTVSYVRYNAIGSAGTEAYATWNSSKFAANTLSSTYINDVITFSGNTYVITLPSSYSVNGSTTNYGTQYRNYSGVLDYEAHTTKLTAYNSALDIASYNNTLSNRHTTSGTQTITAIFKISDDKTVRFTYTQDSLHATKVSIKASDLGDLVTATTLTLTTANAYYTARIGLIRLSYDEQLCVFIDTKTNHIIVIKNPIALYPYTISGHSLKIPIGVAKHSCVGPDKLKFRNFVL